MHKTKKDLDEFIVDAQRELTLEEKATNDATWQHIHEVQRLLFDMIFALHERAFYHDQSKLVLPEVEIFTEYTPKLKGTTYGSDEYKQYLKEMQVALKHHYEDNSHHPEHYDEGIEGMTLIDLIEMLCDWKAATFRHADGDIWESLKINKERFKISDQLYKILKNTVGIFFARY
jgi:hypothetical protein